MIGIDYHGTISKYPKQYKRLAEAYALREIPVYIISAVKSKNVEKVRKEIIKSRVPCSEIVIIPFTNFEDIPQLKLEACKRLGVKVMYDDMEAVCNLLSKNGIMALQVR